MPCRSAGNVARHPAPECRPDEQQPDCGAGDCHPRRAQAAFQQVLEMGMEEGITQSVGQMDALLAEAA